MVLTSIIHNAIARETGCEGIGVTLMHVSVTTLKYKSHLNYFDSISNQCKCIEPI